jgi:hypothetical protein
MVEFDCAVCGKHVEREFAERVAVTSLKEARESTAVRRRSGGVIYMDRWVSGPEPPGGWPCDEHADTFARPGGLTFEGDDAAKSV